MADVPVVPPIQAKSPKIFLRPAPQQGPNGWQPQMAAFLNKDVEVSYQLGEHVLTIRGILRAFHANSLHCIVETPEQMFFVRLPLMISRGRKSGVEK